MIRTAAIHDENPEISGAIARGASPYMSGRRLGRHHAEIRKCRVLFSGTHGKTTTTSMATHIFMEAGADPTVMIGGTLPLLHSGYRVGRGGHHHSGVLRVLQLLSVLLPHGGGDP